MPIKYFSIEEQFFAHVNKNGPLPDQSKSCYWGLSKCWEWTGAKWSGYGSMRINHKSIKSHRKSYELFIGPIPEGNLVCHKCDNRGCANPKHLFLGTKLDNKKDSVSKERNCRGDRPMGKFRVRLTPGQVKEIRLSPEPQRTLAKKYGVGSTTIWSARNKMSWSFMPDSKIEIENPKPRDLRTGRFITR